MVRATNIFTAVSNMNSPRVHFTATPLADGTVLLAGGWNDFTPIEIVASAELFDPLSGIFTLTGSMTISRSLQSATRLPDGTVLILGGSSRSGDLGSVSSGELYDPASGAFHSAGTLKVARDSHSATLLPNGKVLVAGGVTGFFDDDGLPDRFVSWTTELFAPSAGSSAFAGSLETERVAHTATLLNDGRVLVTGGIDNTGAPLKSAELYK